MSICCWLRQLTSFSPCTLDTPKASSGRHCPSNAFWSAKRIIWSSKWTGKGQELLTGGASLAQTAPAPYLGHVALPARLKKWWFFHFVLVPVIACHQILCLFLSLLDSTNTQKKPRLSRASPQSSSVRQPKSLRINKKGPTLKKRKDPPTFPSFPPAHLLQLHSTKWCGQRKFFQSWSGDTGNTVEGNEFHPWSCSFEKH